MSASGLEQAKQLVSAYKLGQTPSMTPELWQAKKIVDSTLHPGGLEERRSETMVRLLTFGRYWRAGVSTLPHVLLRHFQPSSYGRDAHSRHEGV